MYYLFTRFLSGIYIPVIIGNLYIYIGRFKFKLGHEYIKGSKTNLLHSILFLALATHSNLWHFLLKIELPCLLSTYPVCRKK